MEQGYGKVDGRTRDTRASCLTPGKIRFSLLALLAFAATTLLAWQSKPFTNDDVIEMVRAGFGEETILEAIRTNEPRFDTSVEALKALKNAGVGEKIIMAILAAGRVQRGPSAPSSESDALPAEVGIYVLKDGGYIPLEIEPVQWRSRAFGAVTTSGMVTRTTLKVDMETPQSPLQLSGSPELFLVCPEDVTAKEYQLLRAEDKKEGREFRAEFQLLAGSFEVAVGGTGKNKVRFEAEQLVARKFRLKLPELRKSEYAFLPPGKGLQGKLYTFGLR